MYESVGALVAAAAREAPGTAQQAASNALAPFFTLDDAKARLQSAARARASSTQSQSALGATAAELSRRWRRLNTITLSPCGSVVSRATAALDADERSTGHAVVILENAADNAVKSARAGSISAKLRSEAAVTAYIHGSASCVVVLHNLGGHAHVELPADNQLALQLIHYARICRYAMGALSGELDAVVQPGRAGPVATPRRITEVPKNMTCDPLCKIDFNLVWQYSLAVTVGTLSGGPAQISTTFETTWPWNLQAVADGVADAACAAGVDLSRKQRVELATLLIAAMRSIIKCAQPLSAQGQSTLACGRR